MRMWNATPFICAETLLSAYKEPLALKIHKKALQQQLEGTDKMVQQSIKSIEIWDSL